MAIATSLSDYLAKSHINYDVVKHKHTSNSIDTAYNAHIPMAELAKAVVLQDEQGDYLMAVVPATHRLKLNWVSRQLKHRYSLASEQDLRNLFTDCDLGAIPAMGPAYHIRSIYDDQLLDEPCVYIEGGDHQALIKLEQEQFSRLMEGLPHERISASHQREGLHRRANHAHHS